jgi:hypothetical protein
MTPKIFISYSWTSPTYQAFVKQLAERLMADGIDVILDIYDLKEGHDKYAFMERMVTDSTVTHVLMMCDQAYAEKADARKAGVGTESQIISKEVYDKVEQSKFIPIVCELDAEGKAHLPTFLKSRIWINFSTPEAVNENWEQLVRVLHGKPLHIKPQLGKAPAYLQEESVPASPAIAKFAALKQAVLLGKPALDVYRQDFLDACIQYADLLRVRQKPQVDNFGEKVLADCARLKVVRDHIIDWVLLEAPISVPDKFQHALMCLLERLLVVKARPAEVTSWNDAWFEAHELFVYETFLYVVAALLKASAFGVVHEVLTSHYLQPQGVRHYSEGEFATFECFWAYSETLQSVLAPPDRRLISPAAELIKRQADRNDLPFESVMEAELLVLLMALITPSVNHWYPGTLLYASRRTFPFFNRATQHKGFERLAQVTGVKDADQLRTKIRAGHERMGSAISRDFWMRDRSFAEAMNLSKLDSIK